MSNLQDFIDAHEKHDKAIINYLNLVNSANLDEYDKEFVDLYRKGTISINGKQYNLDNLFIEDCNEKIILYDKKDFHFDILSNSTIPKHRPSKYKRFKNSNTFYELYTTFKDRVKDNVFVVDDCFLEFSNIINTFDGSMHDKVPETYYRVHTD